MLKMKKSFRRLYSIVLVTVVAIMSASCSKTKDYDITRSTIEEVSLGSTAEEIIEQVLSQESGIKEYDITQSMNCVMSVDGIESSIYRTTDNIIFTEPLRCEMLIRSNLGDSEEENRYYIVNDKESYQEYVDVSGDVNSRTIEEGEASDIIKDILMILKPDIYFENIDSFSVSKNESDDIVLTGFLNYDAVIQSLYSSGISDVIDTTLMAADVIVDVPVTITIDSRYATVKSINIELQGYIAEMLAGVTGNKLSSFSYEIIYNKIKNVKDFSVSY